MKPVITILLALLCATAFAQQDTTKNQKTPPPPPPTSGLVGMVKFQSYSVYDSTNAAIFRQQALPTDTVLVAWGADLIYCQNCIGERIFVRYFHLKAPGIDKVVTSVPAENKKPEYDEAWETPLGILYITLDSTGQPTSVFLAQVNKYSLRWANPVPKPSLQNSKQ